MKIVSEFAGQNWLITPAALAMNERQPATINDQKWLITLTGVAMVNLMPTSNTDWLRETLQIFPDIRAPIRFAINRHSIAIPTDSPYRIAGNDGIFPYFQLDEWAPFASIGSIFDKNQAVNAGFAVDRWAPSPFATATAEGLPNLGNLFQGIRVDVAVRDIDAILHRVNYQVTLLGKIVFIREFIT